MKQAIVLILAALGIIISSVPYLQAREVSFTLEDRDRIIRLEDGQKATNQRIDDMRGDMNSLRTDMNNLRTDMNNLRTAMNNLRADMRWGFGILFGGMGLLMGFVLWDRRTALAPAVRKTREIAERAELLEKAIKEAAVDNPSLREALKHVGLL